MTRPTDDKIFKLDFMQQGEIAKRLEAVLHKNLDETVGYENGQSDQQVADDMPFPCKPLHVAFVRKKAYGNLTGARGEGIKGRMTSLEGRVMRLEQMIDSLNARVYDLAVAVDKLVDHDE